MQYSIVDDHNADIFAEIPVTKLVEALSVENCEVYSLKEREESLESFYMNLVGGEQHA